MRRQLALAIFFAFAAVLAFAQNPQDVYHAPDGNSRELFTSIYLTPLAGAPFQATITAEWTRHMPNGTTATVVNHRLVARDGMGRIYQERRSLVPEGSTRPPQVSRIEISDPQKHTLYVCNPQLTECELRSYHAATAEPVLPEGAIGNTGRSISRATLGSKTIEGVEVNGTRETTTGEVDDAGNTVENVKEFWLSPKLGLNLEETRQNSARGDEILRVTDLKLSEPDPSLFELPANCKVIDQRR